MQHVEYCILYALWVSIPRHLPYILWVYLSCCISYALWEKHDTEEYRHANIIQTMRRDIIKGENELRPFVWSRAMVAPVAVFFSGNNDDGKLYIRRSLVVWSGLFAAGSLILLLWIFKKLPIPEEPRPVLEYSGIHPIILPYYQDYFERTIARLAEKEMLTETTAVNDVGSKIRIDLARQFEELGYSPQPLHLAVQQYLCADPMFRESHRGEWITTMMYEQASFNDMLIGDNTEHQPDYLPYPPACRVAKNLILALNLGK